MKLTITTFDEDGNATDTIEVTIMKGTVAVDLYLEDKARTEIIELPQNEV